jgi:hypothetical protein
VQYIDDGIDKAAQQQTAAWEVEVSPNPHLLPFSSNLQDFTEGEIVTLSIYNLSGQLVHEETTAIGSTIEMNYQRLDSGHVFLPCR